MATLRETLQYLKQNPNDPRANTVFNGLRGGIFDEKARQEGIDISGLRPNFSMVRPPVDFSQQEQGGEKTKQPWWGRASSFLGGIVGGEKVAEGAGMVLSGADKILSESVDKLSNQQDSLIKKLQEAREKGEDTTAIINALKMNQNELLSLAGSLGSFVDALPTNKQVIGSMARLIATMASGSLAQGVTKGGSFGLASGGVTRYGGLSNLFGVGGASGVASNALRTGAAGASTGLIEGGIHGAGMEAEKGGDAGDIIKEGAIGAGIGLVSGGIVGTVVGGITGKIQQMKSFNQKLQNITPDVGDISPTEYKKLLSQGRITPRTATSPAKFVFSEREAATAQKFSHLIDKDPAKTVINFSNEVANIDKKVGSFLEKNNSIFNSGELKNYLLKSMEGIEDLTVPDEKIITAKQKLVDSFIEKLSKKDMVSLWKLRKSFDRQIKNVFSGSPTLQKQVKIALRESVQNFIIQKTPNSVYANFMGDMSGLINLSETVALKASKQRTLSVINQWIIDNPRKAKLAAGASGLWLFNKVFSPFD